MHREYSTSILRFEGSNWHNSQDVIRKVSCGVNIPSPTWKLAGRCSYYLLLFLG